MRGERGQRRLQQRPLLIGLERAVNRGGPWPLRRLVPVVALLSSVRSPLLRVKISRAAGRCQSPLEPPTLVRQHRVPVETLDRLSVAL